VEIGKHTGLSAVAQVKQDGLLIMAQPVIPCREIVGETPKKVWGMLDERVAAIIDRRSDYLRGDECPAILFIL